MVAAVETMAYVGETPWHGLGSKVEETITLEEFQKEAGLDWTVSKRPVEFAAPNGGTGVFKDRFVLARDSDDHPFSVVSGRYKPVQPKEIFKFFEDLLAMHNMKMHTAGSLMNGGRIWCLAQTGDVHKVLGVDRVDSYLLLSTSYDLTLSTLAARHDGGSNDGEFYDSDFGGPLYVDGDEGLALPELERNQHGEAQAKAKAKAQAILRA